jgi:hypothetical protein
VVSIENLTEISQIKSHENEKPSSKKDGKPKYGKNSPTHLKYTPCEINLHSSIKNTPNPLLKT